MGNETRDHRGAAYLGDGVYARHNCANQIEIYTSNGITESDPIYLEPEVMQALHIFAQAVWPR